MSKVENKLQYSLVGSLVSVVLAQVSDDESVADVELGRFEFDAAEFPAEFQTGEEGVTKTLAGYGLLKLIQDRNSQVSGDAQKKFEGMQAEAQRLLETGDWRAPVNRASGSGATPKADPILAQAVAELQGISIPVATAAIAKLEKEQIAAMKEKPAVKAKMDEIRQAAKDAEAVDLSDLLA